MKIRFTIKHQAHLSLLQAGGLREISRGLSVSDTPGSTSSEKHPEGVPAVCLTIRAKEFAQLRPRWGRFSFLETTGGIVAALLNPRLVSDIAPRCSLGDSCKKLKCGPHRSSRREEGLTLREVLVIMATLGVLLSLLMPALVRRRSGAIRANCSNNLHQIATGFRVWAGDHEDRFPMEVSTNNGGAMEFTTTTNVFPYFQVMFPEIGYSPRVVICPQDTETKAANPLQTIVTNLSRNEQISYFVGLDVASSSTNPAMFVCGDRNISDTDKILHGIFARSTNHAVRWTKDIHNQKSNGGGNILLADGSTHEATSGGIKSLWQSTGIPTNRLALP